MPYFLQERDTVIREIMDQPDCDKQKLFNTYRYFKYINRMLSGWNVIYKKYIRPLLAELGGSATLLDIGSGGADIPFYLAECAQNDQFNLKTTAIDTDPKAFEFIHQIEDAPTSTITFRNVHTSALIEENKRFDIVISNHLLHHLTDPDLRELTQHARQLSRHSVLMNDIRRCDTAYALFYLGTRLVPKKSFIHIDGLISIKRSFTRYELINLLPADWKVQTPYPFRLLAYYNHHHN